MQALTSEPIAFAEDEKQRPVCLGVKTLIPQNEHSIMGLPFLLVREADFPRTFKDPLVKRQSLRDVNDEVDYNSDPELIAKNQGQLLKSLKGSIDRYVSGNPLRFIDNLRLPFEDRMNN